MDNVVYILGAGFSAPLGLPVMGNFLEKSKDLYFSDPETFSHFQSLFDEINKMAVSKNYFETDLFNIEEILSILEMQSQLTGTRLNEDFIRYIKDVIEEHTPLLPAAPSRAANWHDFLFGIKKDNWFWYIGFVANLFQFEFVYYRNEEQGERPNRFKFRPLANSDVSYSVVSLNYDIILEHSLAYIQEHYSIDYTAPGYNAVDGRFEFKRGNDNPDAGGFMTIPLAKLHGSVDIEKIVPPTWSKGVDDEIRHAWAVAYSQILNANHIRILGYSLPLADSYVKYLFKSAILKSQHLKTIDVICLDPDGSVKRRFDDFICFRNYRFVNANILDCLKMNISTRDIGDGRTEQIATFPSLEKCHTRFMNSI